MGSLRSLDRGGSCGRYTDSGNWSKGYWRLLGVGGHGNRKVQVTDGFKSNQDQREEVDRAELVWIKGGAIKISHVSTKWFVTACLVETVWAYLGWTLWISRAACVDDCMSSGIIYSSVVILFEKSEINKACLYIIIFNYCSSVQVCFFMPPSFCSHFHNRIEELQGCFSFNSCFFYWTRLLISLTRMRCLL